MVNKLMELAMMCRVCLLPEDDVDLLDWNQPIDSLEYDLSYKECFCKCTQINPDLSTDSSVTDDGLQYLCFCCAQSLKDAHEFIEKAKKADKELRSKQLDNNFEWVAVSANDEEIDESDPVVDDIKDTMDEQEIQMPSNIDQYNMASNLNKDPYKQYLVEIKMESSVKMESSEESDQMQEVGMNQMVTCKICQKVMRKKTLMKHKYLHKPKKFRCQACPKAFISIYALRSHQVVHEENRERYPCHKCDQIFPTPTNYKKHMQTHDTNRKPMYKCVKCEKLFLHKHTLARHELHHNEPKLKCNFCDKRYVHRNDLKAHLDTHSESSRICNICGKSYVNKNDLKRHILQHEGFFCYTCSNCGDQFSKYDQYYKHRQQHNGFAYKCGSCDRNFTNSYRCKRHIRGVHKVTDESEVASLAVKMNETREHRRQISEFIQIPDTQTI